MTIFEIDAAIAACVDPETGEVDAEQIADLQMEREKKIDNVAAWILDLEGDIKKLADERARVTAHLDDLKNACEKKIEKLKGYLRYALGDTPYKNDRLSVKFTRSQVIKDMTDEQIASLPAEFKTIKTVTTVKPDKVALKKAIKDGWNIAGVEVEERVSVSVK